VKTSADRAFTADTLEVGRRFTSRIWSKHTSRALGSTPYRSTIMRLPLGRSFVSTVDCRASMHVEAAGRKGRAILYLPLTGSMRISVGGSLLTAEPGAPAVLPENTSHVFEATPIRCVLAELSAAALSSQVTAFAGHHLEMRPLAWTSDDAAARAITALIDLLLADLFGKHCTTPPASLARRLEALLVGCVACAVAGKQAKERAVGEDKIGRLTVGETETWIGQKMRDNLRPADLAIHARISTRAMHSAFLRHFSVTFMEYLKQKRLEAARAELLDPQGAEHTTEIAFSLRFGHLGRFADDYRRKFGELPSATLKRRPGIVRSAK
jgi:AraC-like DNA-binding protein